MVGNGRLPVAGSVTSTSIGVPSHEGTRWARSAVGQNCTPARGAQAWPNGAGGAWACADAGTARAATASARGRRLMRGQLTRRPLGPRPLGDFLQAAGVDVVDEPADGVLAGDEGARLDARLGLADVLLEVGERLRGPLRLDAGVLLDLAAEVVVLEGEHAAVGVVDEDDLLGAEQPLRDRQRADLVVGDDPAGVADHVRVALAEPQQPVWVQSRVHARDDGDLPRRRQRQIALVEALGVRLGVAQQLIGDAHGASPRLAISRKLTAFTEFARDGFASSPARIARSSRLAAPE